MSVYAISDLHLSLGTNKEMDVFGGKWEHYTEKLYENWQSTVKDSDWVIIPGDISWATYLEDAYNDFSFLNSLNGKKILLKGNHDYWWTTLHKLNDYIQKNNFNTISFLHNTSIEYCGTYICGTRGWNIPSEKTKEEDIKIFEREKQRLILSLEQAKKNNSSNTIVAMHYPPLDNNSNNTDFINIMKNYNVKTCIYGHLHSVAIKHAITGNIQGINLKLVSCDCINFIPMLLLND